MIYNLTRQSVICEKEKYAMSLWNCMRGLMFRRCQNLVMVFSGDKKVSLHMWFVFFPIDVLIVDRDHRIVEIARDFRPWRMWQSSVQGKYVIELGIKKGKYEVGDVVEFRE